MTIIHHATGVTFRAKQTVATNHNRDIEVIRIHDYSLRPNRILKKNQGNFK